MNSNSQETIQLERLWNENIQRIIDGKYHSYKIDKNHFLGRGGFGIVFGGLCRMKEKFNKDGLQNIKYSYKQVAIKQFKKSQRWRRDQDLDKQLTLLNKYKTLLSHQYVLQVIDIFQQKQSRKYFMVTPLALGGNLNQKITSIKDQQQIYQFCIRLASILKYIHYDALSSYKAKTKGGDEQKQRISIIHRDVKPQNIVFLKQDDMNSLYLLDFGIAKVGYAELQKSYNNCGTSFYKATQINEGRIYNAKVDVYGFACTLYQILNDGQRFLTNAGLVTRYGDRERFIKGRLADLQIKLKKYKKIQHGYYWIKLLHECFLYDIRKRYTSQQLLDYLKGNPPQLLNIQDKSFIQITQKQRTHKQKKETFQMNYQIFRLNMIQNIVFSIFQYIYFDQPRINKFLLYTLIKFIAMTFMDRYNKAKQKFKIQQKTSKYSQLKSMIEGKRINQLRQKAQLKIKKELQKQENNNKIQNKKGGQISDIIKRYPQILHEKVADPKRILSEFCYQKKNQILQNQKFARYVLLIISYLQQADYYDELRLQSAELENIQIQLLSIKKLNYFSKFIEDKLTKEFLKAKLQSCRVQGSLKSNINKQENRTDIEIEIVS